MTRWLLLVVALAGALSPSPAQAIDDDTAEREARAFYEQATRLYNVGELDQAISFYKQAYLRSPAPGLLFNIAQAYRAKRDARQALYFYEAFLRADPDAPERRFVEARMAELRAMPALPPPSPGERDDRQALRTAGGVTLGAGAGLVVAGLVYAVKAHGAFDEVAAGGDPAPGKSSETRAIVLTGAGVVTMMTGAAMFYVGSRPVSVAPVLAPGGAGLHVTTRW
jgi:tetratricopeptide (TPR) repeat protein